MANAEQTTSLFEVLRDEISDSTGGKSSGGGAVKKFAHMPLGEATDMGHAADGTPLIDPRIFDSSEFRRNPYPYYQILRDHYPVFHDRLHNCYYVTRYDDIEAAYFDEIGFNTIPKGSSSGVLGNTQLELSGIEHRRRRNIYGRHLVGAALTKRLPALRALAEEFIDQWWHADNPKGVEIDGDTVVVELGRGFANGFPIGVVAQVLGIPDEARSQFNWWYDAMMSGLGGSDTHHDGVVARQDLEEYVGSLVEERRIEPTHLYDDAGNEICRDIISELCHAEIDGDVMSTEEITSFVALVVGGGGETTRGAIMNLWYLLLQHPDQYQAVLDDRSLWRAAFHEMLRHSTSIGGQPRHNTFEVEMHGVVIPAGSLLHMVDVSANHDDRVFAEPERFDIFRNDLYSDKILRSGHDKDGRRSHMAFGVGPHLCPGAWISEQETIVGAQVLSETFQNIRLEADRMPTDLDGEALAPIGLGAIRKLWLRMDLPGQTMTDASYDEPDPEPLPAAGYRTYEVYQRERVGESTNLLTPRELIGDEMLTNPYRLLTILREHDACYRDWVGNRFWVTRYDDVTSVFADEANFESRPKRWFSGQPAFGRDLGGELPVLWAQANRIDEHLEPIVERVLHDLKDAPDLAVQFAAGLPLELWGAVLDLQAADLVEFAGLFWRMQRGAGWSETARQDGREAAVDLTRLIQPLLDQRRTDPGDDLISAAAGLDLDGGPVDAADIVATIFEADHQTLHGGLANLWFQLLSNPDQLDVVAADPRLMKHAWHEALRHSPAVHSALRFARHEVERFGRLLPEGALVNCSAAAANRDPRVFTDPGLFVVERLDLCQREPRGQYRADGLPSGIAFGLGRPSVHPAMPKERPRSTYAITRDVAVTASRMLLATYPEIRLARGHEPVLRSLRLGEMHTCWELPVSLG